jgi:hypothetical protein
MSAIANMPAPIVGDIVWCIVPYLDNAGRVSQTRHPALVMAVDAQSKSIQVVIVGGASERGKHPKRATDLQIKTTDAWFADTGLQNNTIFHMARRYTLPYNAEHFVVGISGTPKIGSLNSKYPELINRMRRALAAAQTA